MFVYSFDDWTFIDGTDVNKGNVLYVNGDDARAKQLVQFTPSGNAIIKVDNITNGVGNSTYGRLSVQIQSNNSIGPGSLIVVDAVHLPFGVSPRIMLFYLFSEPETMCCVYA